MSIPDRIISNGTHSQSATLFNEKYKRMVSAYVRLPFHLSEEAIPHNPKEIDVVRLQGYCERMMSGLNEDQKAVWQKLYADAIKHIKIIGDFFKSFPDAEFVIDDSASNSREKWLTCSNKKDVINKAAEVDVPEDYKTYFEKVRSFATALKEMRKYEKAHSIPEYGIDEMTYYAEHATEFAGKFVDGYFGKKSNQ